MIDDYFKSQAKKEANANRLKLGHPAREIYLRGIARLGKAEEVASKGNGGRGYVLPVLTKTTT